MHPSPRPPVLLLSTGLLLLGATFAVWRGRRRAMLAALLLPWTLWWAEGLLTLRAQLASTPPSGTTRWVAPSLPAVADVSVPEDLLAAPSTVPTVLVVGDSFTAGQGVTWEDAFPARVERALSASGSPVRVVTHAVPGWNLDDELTAFAALGAPVQPDVIVWVVVLNDLGIPGDPELTDLITTRLVPRPSPSALVDAWRQLKWAREVEHQTVAAYRRAFDPDRPEVRRADADLQALVSSAQAADARFLLVLFPLLHDLDAYPFEAAHDTLARMGQRAGAEVLDLLPVFAGLDERTLWATRADHHPNAEGHALAADAIHAALRDRPLPEAGVMACANLPVPLATDAVRSACQDHSAEGLLAASEALLTARAQTGFDPSRLAALFAAVAAHRDGAVWGRAEAVIGRAREAATGHVTPEAP